MAIRSLLILSLLLCGCTLPVSLLDREFYPCWNADWEHRIESGLGDKTRLGMTRDEFLEAFDAHHLPGTTLEGPFLPEADYWGRPPEDLAFACVYFIRDAKDCPMHRFFFSTDDTLLRWDYLVHELGTYDYLEAPWEYIRLFHSSP